jgi:uncharacterized membrane protein
MQKLRIALISLLLTASFASSTFAVNEPTQFVEGKETVEKALVLSVVSSSEELVPNTETTATYSTIKVRFLEGELAGKEAEISDSTFDIKKGDTVYIRYVIASDGTEYFSVFDIYRFPALLTLFGIFIVTVLVIGGRQGFLSLIALFVSFGFIFKILFPGILTGANIVVVSTIGALLSLFVVMFLTHGISRLTISAYLGCVGSVLVTLLAATLAVKATALTGFATEESVFLNLATKGGLDFVALLIGGIIIGVIGVIDDITITQASVVRELKSAGEHLSRSELYFRAMKVGKDHMGAVVNTLILAYTGASLPLVLLLYVSETPAIQLINSEVITTEIVRTIVGSLGLLAAVPLTTLIAVFLMKKDDGATHASHTHHHH